MAKLVNNQPRWKSKVAWSSLLPIVLILGDTYGLWDIIGMPKNTFVQLITSVGAFLNVVGVFNDPSNKEGF
jgi:uncharacterized membrane protein